MLDIKPIFQSYNFSVLKENIFKINQALSASVDIRSYNSWNCVLANNSTSELWAYLLLLKWLVNFQNPGRKFKQFFKKSYEFKLNHRAFFPSEIYINSFFL